MNWLSAVMSEATGTLNRAAEGVTISVDQDNILEAARIIEAEAVHFERQVKAREPYLYVYRMGGDPVSEEAARVLTEKFVKARDSYATRCLEYAVMLHKLAASLCESARSYGYTDECIRAQFDAARLAGANRSLDLSQSLPHYGGNGVI